ncbi:MAG TPA: aminotransferase class IV [Acidimicrobiales bacterium]
MTSAAAGASAKAVAWVDGRLVDPHEPVLSVMDHGLLVGDGVFESVRVVRGTPLALDRHLARLVRSATALGLAPPDLDAVRRGIDAVLGAGLPDPARLRITVTSGPGPLGSARGDGAPELIVIGTGLKPPPASANVAIVPWPRNERGALAGVKSTSYAENVVALAEANARGADEAIFANTRGDLCEGTSSNVFLVLDDQLITPPVSAGCLAGVTRELVIELVGADEHDVPVDALRRAREAFLTSTTRGVQPIATVDGAPLPACPGAHTRRAADALDRYFGL